MEGNVSIVSHEGQFLFPTRYQIIMNTEEIGRGAGGVVMCGPNYDTVE